MSEENSEYSLWVSECDAEKRGHVRPEGLIVYTGATAHIITDLTKFLRFDNSFQPKAHYLELADGTRCNGVAVRKGDARVTLIDSRGQHHTITLKQAL